MSTVLGIDPGLSGALAVLTTLGVLAVHDVPLVTVERGGKSKGEIHVHALADLLRTIREGHKANSLRAVVERVGAFRANGRQQGGSSMFSFGRSVGQIEGTLAALHIPVSYVTPQVWRRELHVTPGKDGSRLRASQLLPAYSGEWRRVKDDGRAEASLIAMWGILNLPAIGAAA